MTFLLIILMPGSIAAPFTIVWLAAVAWISAADALPSHIRQIIEYVVAAFAVCVAVMCIAMAIGFYVQHVHIKELREEMRRYVQKEYPTS